MSRRTGISQSSLSEAIAGKRKLKLDQALKVARALGVSLDYLADDAQDEPPRPLSRDEEAVLDLFHALGLSRAEALRRLASQPTGEQSAAAPAGPWRLLAERDLTESRLKRDRERKDGETRGG
jgi:transcriptional regulator with XRE-family HTH domain